MALNLRPGWWKTTPAVGTIIVITVIAHIARMILVAIDLPLANTVFAHTALFPVRLVHGEVQQLLTTLLVHDKSLLHILFNMLALYSLGPWVERAVGVRHMVALYLWSGVAGSLAFTGSAYLLGDPQVAAIGASGAVLGVLTAFALIFPDAQLRIWFTAPLRAKNLIWLAIGLDVIMLFADSSIAVAAHFGGMFGGYLYIRRPWKRLLRPRSRVDSRPSFR